MRSTSAVTPQLDFDANAFQDSKGNANDGTVNDNTDVATDDTLGPPNIIDADYDTTTGLLVLTFDDTIDVSATDLGKVFVSKDKKKNQISLSGATILGGDSTIVTIDTTAAQQAAINALPPHHLDVSKNAFTDDDGSRSDRVNNFPISVT